MNWLLLLFRFFLNLLNFFSEILIKIVIMHFILYLFEISLILYQFLNTLKYFLIDLIFFFEFTFLTF